MNYKTRASKEQGAVGTRRVALKPHASKIRRWVDEGRSDAWIAQELNTTPSSVQSFRSRNSIYRRDPVRRGQLSEHPAVLDEFKEGILVRTDVQDSDVFGREWRGALRRAPRDPRGVITQGPGYHREGRRPSPG